MHSESIDESVISELVRQIGVANLGIVIEKVLCEVPTIWDQLVHANHNLDIDSTQRHVHSLASIFRSVGLMRIGDALASIESNLREGGELSPDWIANLERYKEDSLQALSTYMDNERQAVHP